MRAKGDEGMQMRANSSAVFYDLPEIERLVPGLNGLAEAFFAAQLRGDGCHGLTASQLAALGLTADDCRNLIAQGFIESPGRFCGSSSVVLTDAGLVLIQEAIPHGAIRPVYQVRARRLMVAGKVVLPLAVQARNLSAFLTAIEDTGWLSRIEKPLNGRASASDLHRIAIAAHRLTAHQRLIDFHADDGAATWNWRPRTESEVKPK